MTQGKSRYYEEVEVGDTIGPVERQIANEAVTTFCKAWGSEVPNRFTDEKAAREAKLPGPIVPGLMSMAMMAQLLTGWSPMAALKHLDLVFRQPVPHKPVAISAVVTGKREEGGENLVECDIYLSNEESGRLIGGTALISLPSHSSLS